MLNVQTEEYTPHIIVTHRIVPTQYILHMPRRPFVVHVPRPPDWMPAIWTGRLCSSAVLPASDGIVGATQNGTHISFKIGLTPFFFYPPRRDFNQTSPTHLLRRGDDQLRLLLCRRNVHTRRDCSVC